MSKTENIHIRCQLELKEQIAVAAERADKGFSEFCIEQLNLASRHVRVTLNEQKPKKRERTKLKDDKMNFRINSEDKKAIHEIAAHAGISDGEYMIRAALQDQTVVIIDGKEILHQLVKIGTNLNQLTILAHQGKITCPDLGEVNRTLNKVLKQLIRAVKGR